MSETESEVIEETETPSTEVAKPASKRLTPEQWLEIEAHIELDDMTTQEICDKYGISPPAVSQHLSRRLKKDGYHVRRGSRKTEIRAEIEKKIEKDAAERIESFENKRRQRIEDTREKGYAVLQAIGSMAQRITLELMKGTSPTAVAPITPSLKGNDIKALRHLEKLVGENITERLRLLEADKDIDPEKLPELRFRDLTDKEIAEIQRSGGASDLEIEAELELPDEKDDVVIEGP